MTDSEWDQLVSMKREMDNHLMSHDWHAMERFAELMVESLRGKGDRAVGEGTRPIVLGPGDL